MMIKAVSLIAAVIVTSFLMAKYVFDDSMAGSMPAATGAASIGAAPANTPAASSTDCSGGTSFNPFATVGVDCKEDSPDTSAIVQKAKDASSIGKALRELNPCEGKSPSIRCSRTHPVEAKLVQRLEDMARSGNSQARFELAIQLQRQEERSGRALHNQADIAQDTNLQRAVALVAEAAAAGNADAQRLKESMEDGGRIFHTGR